MQTESELYLEKNDINTYKIFKNTTTKLVSPSQLSLKKINNMKENNYSNSNNAFINKINKNTIMNKMAEISNPYYIKKPNYLLDFKRVGPQPFNEDNPYRSPLDEEIVKEKRDIQVPQQICQKKIDFEEPKEDFKSSEICFDTIPGPKVDLKNLEEYEKVLLNKLYEIRMLKEKPKKESLDFVDINCDPIFVYHSNEYDESVKNYQMEKNQHTPLKSFVHTKITKNVSENVRKTKFSPIIKMRSFGYSGKEIETTHITRKSDIFGRKVFGKSSAINDINKNNINKSNSDDSYEYEIDVENEISPSESFEEYYTHLFLFFKCESGTKIRFKIRYDGIMAHAIRAFTSRMNVLLLSDLCFTTEDGEAISPLDTPKSLGLRPYDVIMVSNN